MNFNKHLNLEGLHAVMSPSKHSWLSKSEEDMMKAYKNSFAPTIGTLLHEYAADRIKHRVKLKKGDYDSVVFELLRNDIPGFAIDMEDVYPTLMRYVNDSIGYRMVPEQILAYSDVCFGTCDAIQFRDGVLRIHDLKTGVIPASMKQLEVYAALFFLEYSDYKPDKVNTELRIYQSDEVLIHSPEPMDIRKVMDIIIKDVKAIEKLKAEV